MTAASAPDDADGLPDAYKLYVRQAGKFPVLTARQERELFQALERGDERARVKLVEHNLRLVMSIAGKYANAPSPLVDLIQAGNIGLLRAIEKFDWRRGFKFSTYATWWIKQALQRGLEYDKLIHIPLPVQGALKGHKSQKVSDECREAAIRAMFVDSLDRQRSDDEDSGTLIDIQTGLDSLPPPDEEAQESALTEAIDDALGFLNPREARVLRLRYGLAGERVHSLEEVGQLIGVTRERVRQIQNQAVRRLRNTPLAAWAA